MASGTAHIEVFDRCLVVSPPRNGPLVPHLARMKQAVAEIAPGDTEGFLEVLLRKDDLPA